MQMKVTNPSRTEVNCCTFKSLLGLPRSKLDSLASKPFTLWPLSVGNAPKILRQPFYASPSHKFHRANILHGFCKGNID